MLLIKRYGIPLLLFAVLYSIIYALFGYPAPYFGAGFFVVLALSYLIRICDDICDYAKDKARGRAPIGRGVLIVACCFVSIISLVISLLTGIYLMLIPLTLILLQLLLPVLWRDYIKPLFMPSIVVSLVYSAFTPSKWVFLIAFLLIGVDIAIIIIKRKGK